MGSTDLVRLQRSARLAYELRRVRLALLGILPLIVVVAAAVCVAHRPLSTFWFGFSAALIGATLLWYGREPGRAVLPGIAAGMAPLVLAFCANRMVSCGAEGCSTMCVPACALGGVVAGLAVASVGHQRKAGIWFWVPASGLALLTGAMGCACVGYSGVFGLGFGFVAGVVPGALRWAFGRKAQ